MPGAPLGPGEMQGAIQVDPERLARLENVQHDQVAAGAEPGTTQTSADQVDADPGLPAGKTAYVALRARGARLAAAWGEGPTAWDAVLGAVSQARAELSVGQAEALDTIELSLVRGFRAFDPARPRGRIGNMHRGVHGVRLKHGDHELMAAPSDMIARNQSFVRVLDGFRDRCAQGSQEAPEIQAWTIDADQLLIQLKPAPQVVPLSRSGSVVAPEDVTRANVEAFGQGMTEWMRGQVQLSGRMTYRYFPSRGREASANNMIRQWMATVCLIRAAAAGGRRRRGLEALATRNLEYNLRSSYSEDDGFGIIDCGGKVKLGAVALAALAIVEHPRRSRYAEAEQALRRTVDHLWNEDGSFTTFYRPEGRNDFHNFYPGEALVLWAALYRSEWDDRQLVRIMRTFEYYRAWHLANRNPAFVPWHSQAYYAVWDVTRDRTLQDFVLEMNDWLLGIQQWDSAAYPEMMGQFYDPRRPEYGPPHASSTGVYLEGLIDAFKMARAIGDGERRDAYRLAIVRGLRSVMQLQFRGDADMFYIARKNRVRGALRTTTYDNSVRIDNVQHNLMAVLKILATFEDDDYTPHPHAGEGMWGSDSAADSHGTRTTAVGANDPRKGFHL